MATDVTPPLPDGFQLEGQQAPTPPLPDGFQLEGQQSAPVTATGLLKAGAAGALSGTVGLPGDVVSLINLARKGYSGLTGGQYDPKKDDYSLGQTYQGIRDAADNVYTPQNNAEGWAKTIGEYAPAVLTGPEELAGKGAIDAAKVLAKRGINQAAVPAAASSVASAATEGTPLQPYAAVGAGLLAGISGTRGKQTAPITSEDVAAQTAKNFSDFRTAPVTLKPNVVEDFAKNAQNELTAKGLTNAPANALVQPYIGRTDPVSLNELQETRSLLGKAASNPGTPDGYAAIAAKKNLDTFMDGLQPSDTVVGANALPQAMTDLKTGRANATVQNQLEAIEGKQYRGELNASTAHAGDNGDNAMRQQIKSLLVNDKAMNRLAPYQGDMEDIANGTTGQNLMRRGASLLGGTSGWHSGPWWLAALLAEPYSGTLAATAGAMPFAGMALRRASGATTASKVNALRAKIGANAVGLPPAPVAQSPAMARALIGALSANPSANR